MRDDLYKINFGGCVLHYKGTVLPMNPVPDSLPYNCVGFCCECERRGLSKQTGGKEILMSHGCDGEDIARAIGEGLPRGMTDKRVMFLFENPGGDYGLGIPQTIQHADIGIVTKTPPVKHYYWTTNAKRWPQNISEVYNPYGDFLAYLIYTFGLVNVYVTNCIKCKYTGAEYGKTAANCMNFILKSEIDAFKPEVIFCFGRRAYNLLTSQSFVDVSGVLCKRLLHPAQRRYKRCRYYEMNKSLIEECGFVARAS